MHLRRTLPALLSLSALAATARGQSTTFTLEGAAAGDDFGRVVAPAGDVDLDGIDDFAVGEPTALDVRGRVSVLSGVDRSLLWSKPGEYDLDRLGMAVACVGDVDLDGRPDLLVGAPGAPVGGSRDGLAYVLSGSDGAVLRTLHGNDSTWGFGSAVSSAGDVDGDGIAELLVGAPNERDYVGTSVYLEVGAVYAFSGASGAELWHHTGVEPGEHLGIAVCGGLDLDGDGVLEVLVGALDFGAEDKGRVVLYSGLEGQWLGAHFGGGTGSRFGGAICALADATGDGVQDVAVGATGYPIDGTPVGAAFVYSGHLLTGAAWLFGSAGSEFGASVAPAGDVDGDGLTDLAIGAPKGLPMLGEKGFVAIESTVTGEILEWFVGPSTGSRFGITVASLDVNGDGVLDLIAGAPSDAPNGSQSGSARIVLMGDAAGVPYCFGEESGTGCPCGASDPALRAGCPNSTGSAGKLAATGGAYLSNDTVQLRGSGMPNSPCLYFQGTLQVNGGDGAVFGDGLRCAGGAVTRLATRVNSGGASELPSDGEPSLSSLGGAQAGDTLHYQVWYRDSAAFCTSATNNFTNGYSITWQP